MRMRLQWRVKAGVLGTLLCMLMVSVMSGCGREDRASPHKIRSMSDLDGRSQRQVSEDDKRAMWEIVRHIRGVADMDVRFSGADVYVTLVVRDDLQPREVPSVEKQAATALRFHFPRYVFHMQTTMRQAKQSRLHLSRKAPGDGSAGAKRQGRSPDQQRVSPANP
jgi:hypothetical protein